MFHVLLIEDDPMVQMINKEYVEKNKHFRIMNMVRSITDAKEIIKNEKFDLILLDDNLDGHSGLEFMAQCRMEDIDTDFIMLTANNNIKKIEKSRNIGAFDYIIKPFTFERLQQSLIFFQRYKDLQKCEVVSQDELDQAYLRTTLDTTQKELNIFVDDFFEKGISRKTLELILNALRQKKSFIIEDLSNELNLSHVTIRKYIRYLEKKDILESTQEYGEVGRPLTQYQVTNKINDYR